MNNLNSKKKETWYVLSCSRGNEETVKQDIILAFENSIHKNKLKEIKIIWKKIKGQSNNQIQKNFYPGYIYINVELDNDTWYLIRNIKNVFSFIGSSGKRTKPVALTYKEVQELYKKEKSLENQSAVYDIPFEIGQTVIVKKHEIFKNQKGIITSMNLKNGIVSINIIFMNKKHKLDIMYVDLAKV